MQQYRLNYSLLIGLAIGGVLASGAVYGLWKFQIERKSGVLLGEAEKARAAGNYRDAAHYYSHYLSIHGGDDETRVKLAEAYADRLEQDDVQPEEVGIAIRVLESTVREMPDAMGVQRRLAELYGQLRRYQDALDHLNYLLEKNPDDAELQSLRAQYLVRSGNLNDAETYSYKLVGYDSKTDTFDDKKATTPHDIPVYNNLARILRTNQDKPDLADRVMEQMIKLNSESAQAYLVRGSYWITADEKERGQEDIEKAYQLDPKNVDVLLVLADQAAKDDQTDKAREYLATGKKLHPDEPSFYKASADLDSKQGKYKEALAEIEAGIKAVGAQKGRGLLFDRADLQLASKDFDGVHDTIRQMKDAGYLPEIIEWQEARILLTQDRFHEATAALNRLKPRMANFGEMSTQIDYFLGLSYERLGSLDQALDAYELVLQANPEHEPAKLGRQRVMTMLAPEKMASESDPVPKELSDELLKPKDKQDAAKINQLVEKLVTQRKLNEFDAIIFKVQIALTRQDYAGARNLLREADKNKPKNQQVYLALVSVARLDPKVGPAKAMEMWQRVAKDFGDSAEMRLNKADILIALGGDQLKPELASLLAGINDWKPEQKVMVWGGMAQRYLNLGMMEEAQQYLSMVADERPNELPTRVTLFTLALETGNDDGMKEAQKKILQIVKDTNDSTYLYTEARRQLSLVRRGMLGPEALPGIRELVNKALEQRPDWHELWLANGDVELYANNPQLALEHYAKAEKSGRPNPRAVAQHVRLLALFGQYRQAGELLDRIPESIRQQLLENFYTEILFRTDKVEDAIREARTAAEAAPTDPAKQFWHGQLLARSAQMPDLSDQQRKTRSGEAIAALRRAVDLEPELPDAWYALITLNAQQDDLEGAQQALRDAQLSLAGNNLQLFLAKSYEALGHWFDAETMYRAVYDADPKDIRRAQQLAEFYLGPVYQLPDRREKVTPLLNQILRAGAEVGPDGKKVLAPNDGNLLWARRKAAEILASTRDYQNILKAEKLLSSSSQGGSLSVEDRLQMAQILKSRPEPESRKKAAGLLEEVAAVQPLGEAGEIALGQLYYVLGEWNKCRGQMVKTLGRFPKSIAARESYIDMLLTRNDPRYYSEAEAQLKKLQELAPGGRSTFALNVKLANKQGNEKAVRAQLLRMVPKIDDASKLTDEQSQFLAFLATLFIELDDQDNAERLFRQLAAKNPKLQFPFADFLGQHRDVGQCFELLAQLYSPESVNDVLTVAINALRTRRDEIGTKYDAQVEQWLDRAKRENPESIPVLMLEADLYDVQKKYEEAADIYRNLLAKSDLDGFRRAIVLNNLSFLVALAGSSADAGDLDALKLVEEAEQILGPNADILDTKAVVLIERKRYKEAIEELNLSVTDQPTGAKYFHLVVAHLGAGQNRDAMKAWDQAEAQGLTRDALNRLEHSRYDQVKAKIDQLRTGSSSVSRNEPVRQAP